MTPETFCEQFATFAEAPNGVAKLRELILQLAVQGKLGTQDVNDEPASALIGFIEKRKSELFRQGLIPKQSALPTVPEDNLPFNIPAEWQWIRLESVCEIITKGSSPTWQGVQYVDADDGVLFVTSENVGNYVLRKMDEPKFVERKFNEMEPRSILQRDDLLVNLVGGSIGRSAIFDRDDVANINQAVGIIRLVRGDIAVDRWYLLHYLNSPVSLQIMFAEQVETARANLSLTNMKHFLVPLPPLAEQRRIVEKVDQLLGLCDELAARQAVRREARSALVGATLDRLVSARSSAEFPVHAHRLRDHFDRLFDTPTTIPQLRQAILQLAVQGQLVPQDPNDEPASVLRSKILTKRKRLIENGEFTAFATDTEWPDGVLPHSLPEGWEWIRFGELGGFLGGGTPSKDRAEFWDGKIPWVSPKDMKRPYMDDAIDHVSPLGVENSSGKMIPKGSLLIVVRGMILAHSFPVALAMRELTINQDMKALQLAMPELGEYLLRCCAACKPRMLACVERSSHGTCRLPTEAVANFPIPVPPLSEQKRIVSKVTELLSLCDALEAKLTQAESASTQLLSAAVHHLLAESASS